MEGFSSKIADILSNYTYECLRQISKKLSVSGTKKNEMISSIVSFITKTENQEKLALVFPAELLKELSQFLPDKDLVCVCDDQWKESSLIQCSRCLKKVHRICMGDLIFLKKFVCITCQLKYLNPADEVLEFLVPPFILSGVNEKIRRFNYSKSLKTEVLDPKMGVEVQFRCVKIQRPGFCIAWPRFGSLKVNSKVIKEFKGGKGKGGGLDLSILLNLGVNEVGFVKKNDPDEYCLAVMKVRKHSSAVIFQRLVQNTKPYQECLKTIQQSFTSENELTPSMIKIILKCPYSLQQIKYPTRGEDCIHSACFDLMNFVEFQKFENYSWKCPICKGPAYNTYIDGYLLDILKRFNELEGIEVTNDGNFVPILQMEPEASKNEKRKMELKGKKQVRNVEIISIDAKPTNLIIIDD